MSEAICKSNFKKFCKYIFSITPIFDEKIVVLYLSHLTEEEQDILFAMWGIDGSKRCKNFKALVKKTGNPNAPQLYKEAEKSFKKQVFVEMLIDNENFSKDLASSLGFLISYILYGKKNASIFIKNEFVGEAFLITLSNILTEEESVALKLRYGIEGEKKQDKSKIAEILDIPTASVSNLLKSAFLKLINNQTKFTTSSVF